jgi:biotin/methionine sulfoxide reductase
MFPWISGKIQALSALDRDLPAVRLSPDKSFTGINLYWKPCLSQSTRWISMHGRDMIDMKSGATRFVPTCSHWGNYRIETDGGKLLSVQHYESDREPTPIGQSLLDALDEGARIPRPMVRAGYLEKGRESDGAGRGREPFVPVSWDVALDLATQALSHTYDQHGPNGVYGGSYGWASAGRFHHAQSQIHRFLNLAGGYVDSVNSYSTAAAEVIMGRITGIPFLQLVREAPSPAEVAEQSKTMVLFGGAAMKNTQVNAGGIGSHSAAEQLRLLREAGVKVINVSPVRDDVLADVDAWWWPCRPGSDVAIMLALAHTLVTENLHDHEFLDRYTVGFDKFLPYLLGEEDGQPKDVEWASAISEIPAHDIRDLALELGRERSVLGISWSLQRQEFGEQSYWMITTLAAMLGHIGIPGAGIGYGYGCIHNFGFGGRRIPNYRMGALGQEIGERTKPRNDFIPVARHTDMLNNPGACFDYDGQTLTYPDIKLIYWAGGNPFHHHQDLNELRKAWEKPETIIVNESFWTASARHADIVFPCTTTMERNDIGGSSYDAYLSPMRQVVDAFGESRSDFEVFAALAARLGLEEAFTEGRDEMQWVEHIYTVTRENAAKKGVQLPEFEAFWEGEQIEIGSQLPDAEFTLEKFRRDPEQFPLRTPSGKIEIFSEDIESFGYDDCRGHPRWYEHVEWLGGERAQRYSLHMISNQPRTRLHSQYDHASTSRKRKIQGRERARMNAGDATARGIADADVIKVYNDRGACLAGVELSADIRPGVIELPTGAWYDPQLVDGELLDVHGNPNAITPDRGTSSLAQGCSGHSCLVEVEKYEGELPEVSVFRQPPTRS